MYMSSARNPELENSSFVSLIVFVGGIFKKIVDTLLQEQLLPFVTTLHIRAHLTFILVSNQD